MPARGADIEPMAVKVEPNTGRVHLAEEGDEIL